MNTILHLKIKRSYCLMASDQVTKKDEDPNKGFNSPVQSKLIVGLSRKFVVF